MTLTREFLTELNLPEDAISRILDAHTNALDAHQAEAARIQGEFDVFRLQVDQQRTHQARQAVIRAALVDSGANEAAAPLLALAVSTTEEDWDGASLRDASAVLAPVREQYAGFFSQRVPLSTDRITPPLDGGTLSLEDVRRMSPGEINDNWSLVCAALAQRS
ncbi:MAG: hypothetical protein IJE07_12155 [Clostridia bacterium]|nr:hypothetical protein [Clostridia bacterium]